MRRIVLDDVRKHRREKRGGAAERVPIEEVHIAAPAAGMDPVDALELDRALSQLEALDADQGRIVEPRYYGGLTIEETAAVMGMSTATIKRERAMAKGWLYRALTDGTSS